MPAVAVASDDVSITAFVYTWVCIHDRILRGALIVIVGNGDMISGGNLRIRDH